MISLNKSTQETYDQHQHLTQYGLAAQPLINQQQYLPTKRGWFSKLFRIKVTSKSSYGAEELVEFQAAVKECENLAKLCESKRLFRPADWKQNDIDWRTSLLKLKESGIRLADIRKEKMKREFEDYRQKNY